MAVVSMNSTVAFDVVLLGATVCPDTRDTLSNERHIANQQRERVAEDISDSGRRYGR